LAFLKDEVEAREFIATHKRAETRVGVEAKSRRRAGVLHEKGFVGSRRCSVAMSDSSSARETGQRAPFIV
jgi:hypothetical protein